MQTRPIIERAWCHPEKMVDRPLSEWDTTIHQGRRADLLAELYYRFADHGLLDAVPAAPRRHLESARILADKHRLDVLQELRHIEAAFASASMTEKPILLKGAAYLARNNLLSRGRIFSDIDILIPQHLLPQVEQALRRAGWVMPGVTPYDNKYYRTWMHQIPPMFHIRRATNVDVHHTILPLTARERLDPVRLYAAAVPVDGEFSGYRTLSAVDMLLHSATHLFHEGEFDHGLRDLIDLDYLFRGLQQDQSTFASLMHRAIDLDLQDSLYYAAHFTEEILGTVFPGGFKDQVSRLKPKGLRRVMMDRCLSAALIPRHPTTESVASDFARWILYVRGHYLRMPFYLLIPHLVRKSFEPKR